MMSASTPTEDWQPGGGMFSLAASFASSASSQERWPVMLVGSESIEVSRKTARWDLNKRDPVAIERSNLINISKLVVKELLESSAPLGRQLDSDHVPLQHFFIVLEHALRHGLRPKRGLLGPKKELWDILQMVEKMTPEAIDITSSVRDLPTVKTPLGRARAWLRLALMQKKLPDYVRLLLDRADILQEHYEPGALMLSEEAVHVLGLLVGLNIIDCNLCMKEEDLDSQQGVIDFSLYLRSSPSEIVEPPTTDMTDSKYERVLDQKNYIEELNRHLNATVSNLQAKLEQQVATTALLREDLAMARSQAAVAQRLGGGTPPSQSSRAADALSVSSRTSERSAAAGSPAGCAEEIEDLRAQLREERAHRKELEKELQMQVQMGAEMEMATKLLEKDVHEKQDTMVTLRRQLDDIKAINLEMYNKLQECEAELAGKGSIIARLQARSCEVGRLLANLQTLGTLPPAAGADHHGWQRAVRRRHGMKCSRSAHVIGDARLGPAAKPEAKGAGSMAASVTGGGMLGLGSVGGESGMHPDHISKLEFDSSPSGKNTIKERAYLPRLWPIVGPPPEESPTSNKPSSASYIPHMKTPTTPYSPENTDVSLGIANTRMEQECGLTPDSVPSYDCELSMEGWETIDEDCI